MEKNRILSEAFNPVEQVEYATGSVVSKTIIKGTSGNITFFAFDQGEGLSEHSTHHDAFVQVLDGEAEITIGGQASVVRTPHCIIMPAHIPHALKAVKRFKMMLVMIKNQ